MVEHDPARHDFVIERIAAILAGRPPEAQGALLAELVATFFCGHHPAAREEMIALWIETMRDLIPVVEKIRFGEGGFPADSGPG
jgi:hypothetical protein